MVGGLGKKEGSRMLRGLTTEPDQRYIFFNEILSVEQGKLLQVLLIVVKFVGNNTNN